MQYLIDGHNLIGRMPDIDLGDPDDEVELVLRLRSWSAAGRKRKVTVIFDRGLPGGKDKALSSGQVKVVFAPAGRSADSLLINRISSVKNPAEYTLVSSDQKIVRAAEARRMLVWRSEEFVGRMNEKGERDQGHANAGTTDNPQMSVDEVQMWLNMFSTGEDD